MAQRAPSYTLAHGPTTSNANTLHTRGSSQVAGQPAQGGKEEGHPIAKYIAAGHWYDPGNGQSRIRRNGMIPYVCGSKAACASH